MSDSKEDFRQEEIVSHLPRTITGSSKQDPNEKPLIGWTPYIIVALCALAQFQNTFQGIAPPANQYSIAGALNGNSKRLWIVQSNGIPSIVSGPIFAIIADTYGRKWVVIFAWTLQTISSIISMTANSIDLVILGQTLSGVACGINGICYAIPSEVLPAKYRAYVQTFINWVSGLSSIPALIACGAAVKNDPVNGWRWVFRILLILNATILLGFIFFYRPPPRTVPQDKAVTFRQRIATLDWIGYALLIGGLVPLLMGFAWASDPSYGWKNSHSFVSVTVGVVSFIACLLYEWKGRSDGFLHHGLFSEGRNFPLATLIIAVEGSLFYMVNNIYPSAVFGLYEPTDAIRAGAYLLPFFMAVTVISPFIAIYCTKRSDVKWPILAGFVCFTGAVIGFGQLTPTSNGLALAMDALAGFGFSSPLIMVITIVQLSTPPWLIATASALTISARTLGGTVGYGIALVIQGNELTKNLPKVADAAIAAGLAPQYVGQLLGDILSHNFAGLAQIPGIDGRIIGTAVGAFNDATARSLRITWLAFIPGCIVACIATAFLQNPKDRFNNWIVDAPLQAIHHDHELGTTRVGKEHDELSK